MLKLMTFNFNVRFTLSVSLVNLFSVNQGARGMPWIMYLLWVFHHYGMKCAICRSAEYGGSTSTVMPMPSACLIRRWPRRRKNSHVAALVMGNKPKDIISLDHTHGPDNIALFTLPNRPQALEEIHRDLVCSLEPGNYLFILLCAENAWQNINNEKLCAWVEKTSRWAQYHRCAFLAINSAQDIDRQLTPLLREYRSLSGLASIRYQGDRHISLILPGGKR